MLLRALRASRAKVTVFVGAVADGGGDRGRAALSGRGSRGAGFDNIPRGIYWAIVTLTTVGYGDLSPQSPLGQVIASVLMIMGYGIIAVPTGIVSVEIANASRGPVSVQACPGLRQAGPRLRRGALQALRHRALTRAPRRRRRDAVHL